TFPRRPGAYSQELVHLDFANPGELVVTVHAGRNGVRVVHLADDPAPIHLLASSGVALLQRLEDAFPRNRLRADLHHRVLALGFGRLSFRVMGAGAAFAMTKLTVAAPGVLRLVPVLEAGLQAREKGGQGSHASGLPLPP